VEADLNQNFISMAVWVHYLSRNHAKFINRFFTHAHINIICTLGKKKLNFLICPVYMQQDIVFHRYLEAIGSYRLSIPNI